MSWQISGSAINTAHIHYKPIAPTLKLPKRNKQEWSDYKLKWDPSEYGGIEDINLPAEQIWLPDIVLYNRSVGAPFWRCNSLGWLTWKLQV